MPKSTRRRTRSKKLKRSKKQPRYSSKRKSNIKKRKSKRRSKRRKKKSLKGGDSYFFVPRLFFKGLERTGNNGFKINNLELKSNVCSLNN